jgi:hypothetical protein
MRLTMQLVQKKLIGESDVGCDCIARHLRRDEQNRHLRPSSKERRKGIGKQKKEETGGWLTFIDYPND